MSQHEQILESLYRDNVEKLYKFFYFKVLDAHTAEDLTSETFMAMAEKVASLSDEKDTLEKYLYGIAKNKWNLYLRKKYQRKEMSLDDIGDFATYVKEEVDAMESRSLKERAIYFINLLPTAQRVVAMLRLIEGLLPSEIAIRIDRPLNYVKVTLRRALKRLRELVAQSNVAQRKGSES